jgi:glycosyl transferase family 25
LGYVLTRAGAEKILAKVPPIFRPVDEDHKHFWEFDLRVAMIAPQTIAIGAQETSDGTVGDSRKKMAQKDPIWVRLWRFGRYRVNYRLHLARARAKGL